MNFSFSFKCAFIEFLSIEKTVTVGAGYFIFQIRKIIQTNAKLPVISRPET